MNLTERQKSILAILKRWRTASVGKLAKTLGVSDASIRRDLIEMQTLGFLDRTHGGAVIAEGAEETSLFLRINENAAEKEQAAANALPHLPRFDSVFFDGSTTALALAARMDLAGKTVMTTNLQTALQLSEREGVRVMVPGGTVTAGSVAGSWTNSQLPEFEFDLLICSCSALTLDGAYETSLDLRELKRIAFAHAQKHVLVLDRSKLHKTAGYFLSPLSGFDLIVFDYLSREEKSRFSGFPVVG